MRNGRRGLLKDQLLHQAWAPLGIAPDSSYMFGISETVVQDYQYGKTGTSKLYCQKVIKLTLSLHSGKVLFSSTSHSHTYTSIIAFTAQILYLHWTLKTEAGRLKGINSKDLFLNSYKSHDSLCNRILKWDSLSLGSSSEHEDNAQASPSTWAMLLPLDRPRQPGVSPAPSSR